MELIKIKEKVLNLVNDENYTKLKVEEIEAKLNIQADDFKDLIKVINELEDDGTLYITSKGFVHLASKLNIFVGKIKSCKKYYAVCMLNNGDVVNITNEYLKNAYTGDSVRIHLMDKGYGEVIDIINRNMWDLAVTYKGHKFICEDRNFPYDIQVKKDSSFYLVDGHVVLLHIDKYNGFTLMCHISKILGHKNDVGMDILTEVIKSGVPYEFSDNLIEFTDRLIDKKLKDLKNECATRLDLTQELIVTIDGLDAKDLDDAISLTICENGNYKLGVHIADVSNYVTSGSLIDKEAFARGTSIYLADRVIPMLPHSLSNGICSLNQDVIRLTMSCIMEIDGKGKVVDYDIKPSFICSKGRLDYDDVNHLFNNEKTTFPYSNKMKEMLYNMRKLSGILSDKMDKRGYLQLNIDEAKLILDEQSGKVIDIKKRVQGEAEKLIENFMILANETVASHIFYQQLPFIYRVHAAPSDEKMMALVNNLEELNLDISIKGKRVTSNKLQQILNAVKGSDKEDVTSSLILRCMSKAVYSVNNIGHFGLGSDCYTHFTSPIRRYPDLIVHRFLKQYGVENNLNGDINYLLVAAENSSMSERRAIGLERNVEDIKKAEYMSSFIGCTYKGIITGVLDFGVFVALENTCEGLMRFETIPNVNSYNETVFQNKFKVGQPIMVKLLSCIVKNGEINFAYVSKKNYNSTGDRKNVKTSYK